MKTPIDSARYPGLYKAARSEFRSFRAHLMTRFSEEHRGDPQKLRIIFATLAQLNFPGISRGRPQDERITLACQLRARKKPWLEVYKVCRATTLEDKTRLHDAVRKRHRAIQTRTHPLCEARSNSTDCSS